MKRNPLLSQISAFLLPIIFLYGTFYLVIFVKLGFIAIISSIILLVIGTMLCYMVNISFALFFKQNFEYILFFAALIFMAFITALLLIVLS